MIYQIIWHNQPIIKDVLPNNLTKLTFGIRFNRLLTKDILPNNLTQLIIQWKNNWYKWFGLDFLTFNLIK